MEKQKTPNKYASFIRVMCYILIPIFVLVMVQSVISIAYFSEQKQNTKEDNYYKTSHFAQLYKQSIYNNVQASYSYIENKGYEVNISNLYGVTEANSKTGNIYYKNYLEDKNFKFLIVDNKTNIAFTNLEQTMRTDTIEKIIEELNSYSYYWNYEQGNVTTNIEKLTIENIKYVYDYKEIEKEYDCKIYTAMQTPLEYYDDYYTLNLIYNIVYESNEIAIINLMLGFIGILICMIVITILAGRKRGKEEIELDIIDKVPFEILVIFVIAILSLAFVLGIEISYSINLYSIAFIVMLSSALYVIGIGAYETFIKRIKTRTLFKNTLCYRFCRMIKRIARSIFENFSLATKIALVMIAFGIGNMIFIHAGFIGFLILTASYILIFKYSFSYIRQFLQIKEMAKQIYEGNTEIRLEEDEYKGILKELCKYLNDIAGGFTNAIEKGLKSERMKTELITNVSHDIKTPLTSIINYVDLLKKEKMPNEKAKEYLDILDKKSQRLKRLTEDLVEASKASSGNIKLNMEKLDVKELIKQVSGEFEDKLKEKKLELILNMPEENTSIKADSRYLYRVVENMYSNIVKYALPSSRVYADIILDKENVRIELKNISKEKLNISADELMERFVRGESSRNTEGSGLRTFYCTKLNRVTKWNVPNLFRWRLV